MDYIGYTMNICLILFMISVTGSRCQYYSNRDIILTPHQLKTYPGKILYYRPHELTGSGVLDNVVPAQQQQHGGSVPWEDVLKETVFLALNDNKTSVQSADGSTTTRQPMSIMRRQKAIYGAPYIGGVDLSVPRFGDIVELAHGRLEQENDDAYFFVQDDLHRQQSGRNVSAFWKVERIRHRDEQRGHRYELKFTVAPVKDFLLDENAIVNRSFIVRDEDYPRYFGMVSPNAIPMMKKNDQLVDRAVFDPLFPYHQSFPSSRFYRPTQPTITLGEYLIQSFLGGGDSSAKNHHYSPNPFRFGSTFNRVKFPDSFTTSSHTSPKFYHHIHFQRPSIAPLAPTLQPMPPLIKEIHAQAPSNIQQDYTKLVDYRGATDSLEAKPNAENSVVSKPFNQQSQVQQQNVQNHRYPPPLVPIQPTHIHHHHHTQPPQQQQQQQQLQQQLLQPQQHLQPIQNQQFIQQQNNPPPLQALPPNLVQSIPVYNSQNQVMLNHIPISQNHMIQVSQGPIAIPVHLQLVPSQGQIYAPPQDGLHAVPIRIMQQAPLHIYSPVNHFLAPQHHPAFVTPKYTNQSHHFSHHSPNSIPTTLKYTTSNGVHALKYTPQPSTSPFVSPTTSNHRYSSLPTAQASPAGLREKFTAPAFQPVTSSSVLQKHKLEPDTAGSSSVDSASPKFQSFGIENAVTPKPTTVLPVGASSDNAFSPSIGHTSSVHSGFYSNFIDEKGSVSEGSKLYSEPDPLYHKSVGTTPITITTATPPASHSGAFSYTARPSFTPKFSSYTTYKVIPSATIVPPQIETPISSTLKSYHYLGHHDSFDFVPSRVVELAHVKKIPKKQGSKRKNHGNHHHVTVTSHKPLKFSEAPDFATHRPESQFSVQLPPPEKEFSTYYGSPKQNHKVQKPKNYITQPYTSSTTPFPTSLTTPAASTTASTTPTPSNSSSTTSSSTSATTEKPSTHFQPYFKNKHEKSDDIITTIRPRLVIKTVYKPYSSSTLANSASAGSTEKPILKWIPKRPRKNNNSSAEPSPSSATSSSASIEQISASSEHAAIEVSAGKSAQSSASQGVVRSSLENQMNRLRASRGRSRYTHRRVTTPGTPPASQHPMKAHRMRSSSTSTTTSTVKPVSGVTASTFDSNRLDNRPPTEAEDRQPEESIVSPISLKNMSNEKIKRDTATEENEVLVAEPLVAKLSNTKVDDYEMVKASVKPIETNSSNMVLFEASDNSIGTGRGASSSPTFDELTMSIINHARAIVNQTEQPEEVHDRTLQTNEIDHKEEIAETTLPMSATSTTVASTNESSLESTIHSSSNISDNEQKETTSADTDETESTGSDSSSSNDSSRSETTVSVDN